MAHGGTVVPWPLLYNVVSYLQALSRALLLRTNHPGDGDLWTSKEGVFAGESRKELWEAGWGRDRS